MYTVSTTSSDPSSAVGAGLFGYVLYVVALWPVFRKAGYPGWGALIPIYNVYLLVKVAGYSGWLLFGYIVPIVNIVVSIVVAFGAGRAFGKDGWFSFLLLWLFSPIGLLIIGYGNAQFRGPGGSPDL